MIFSFVYAHITFFFIFTLKNKREKMQLPIIPRKLLSWKNLSLSEKRSNPTTKKFLDKNKLDVRDTNRPYKFEIEQQCNLSFKRKEKESERKYDSDC